jgi:4-hydroxy-tetrahydrodipicolinate reductase
MSQYPAYEAKIEEIHHTRKLDAPSGTAILIAEQMLNNYPLKTAWSPGETASPTHLPVYAERIGDVPGTHIVSYTSSCDQLVFKHEAFNRQGFASGALAAAQWILGKKGVFSMSDMLVD